MMTHAPAADVDGADDRETDVVHADALLSVQLQVTSDASSDTVCMRCSAILEDLGYPTTSSLGFRPLRDRCKHCFGLPPEERQSCKNEQAHETQGCYWGCLPLTCGNLECRNLVDPHTFMEVCAGSGNRTYCSQCCPTRHSHDEV